MSDVYEEYEEIVRSRLGPVEPRIVGLSRWSQDDLIRRIFAEDEPEHFDVAFNASGTSATWPTTTFTNQPPKETPNA